MAWDRSLASRVSAVVELELLEGGEGLVQNRGVRLGGAVAERERRCAPEALVASRDDFPAPFFAQRWR